MIKVGNAIDVLEKLHECYSIDGLWSHQETWNGWTYARDNAVKRWCKSRNILWHEPVQNGVVRRLDDRDGWAARWYHQIKKPLIDKPLNLTTVEVPSDVLPSYTDLGLTEDGATDLQKGGRIEGFKLLNSFLYERGEDYTKEMSSPVTAFESCSRISAHLAFGTLSMREVFQACEKRNQEIKQMPYGGKGKWPSAM